MKLNFKKYLVKPFSNYPKSFIYFLIGSFVSKIGDSLFTFAIPWISYELTKSAAVMGSLFATSVLPIVLFGPFIGVMVDRIPKKKLLVSSDIARAVLVSPLLHLLDRLEIWHLYVLTFLLTILSLMFDVTTVTVIPEIAGKQLIKANSTFQFISQLANFVGPIIAGLLISTFGGYQTLWIDVISFSGTLIAVLTILSLRKKSEKHSSENIFKSMADGFSWLKNDRLNFCFSLQAMMGNFGYTTAFAVFIYYLRSILHLNSGQVGVNFALLSLGGFIGTIIGAPIEALLGRRMAIPALLVFGTVGFMIAILPSIWFAPGIGFGMVGVCNVSWNIIVTSLRQESVPKELLGRVLSFSRVFTRLAMPIGAMVGGMVSAHSHPSNIFMIASISKLIEVLIAVIWIRPLLPMKNSKKQKVETQNG